MLTRIRALIDRWQELASLDDLTERDLNDLGMTRAQVKAFVTMPPEVPDRVARMAAIFGVPEDELKASPADYLALLGTCRTCRDRTTCARKFDSGAITSPAQASFCPNADIYTLRGTLAA